ncbi:MAG: cytochrome c [Chloroflexi bacterium]|nr:cytochrome c [Chloroflexota bacterium]
MRMRFLAFSLGLLALLAVAAACASPTSTSAPTVAPTSTRATTPTSTATSATGDAIVQKGKTLAAQCAGCHSTDGRSGVGPTWKGLFGATVALTGGATVTADEAYLEESIKNPNAKIVAGFSANVMSPGFGTALSNDDIAAIIEYIKSLK